MDVNEDILRKRKRVFSIIGVRSMDSRLSWLDCVETHFGKENLDYDMFLTDIYETLCLNYEDFKQYGHLEDIDKVKADIDEMWDNNVKEKIVNTWWQDIDNKEERIEWMKCVENNFERNKFIGHFVYYIYAEVCGKCENFDGCDIIKNII